MSHAISRDMGRAHTAFAAILAAMIPTFALFNGMLAPMIWAGFGLSSVAIAAGLIWAGAGRAPFGAAAFGPWFALAALVPLMAVWQAFTPPLIPALTPDWGGVLPPEYAPVTHSLLPQASFSAGLRAMVYILWAALILEVAQSARLARIMAVILFCGVVIHALLALGALNLFGDVTLWGGPKAAYLGVATGAFVSRNVLAMFLVMGLGLGCGLIGGRGRLGLGDLVIALGILCIFVALWATGSRLGLSAGLIVIAACLWGGWVLKGKTGWRILAALALIGAVIFALVLAGDLVIWRLLAADADAAHRLVAWVRIWDMIAARPWTGYGLDAFRPAYEVIHGGGLDGGLVWDRAHSAPLTLWVELGVIIGSVPMILTLCAWVLCLRHLRQSARERRGLRLAALAVTLGVGMHAMGDFGLEIPSNAVLFITILTLALAPSLARHAQDNQGRAQKDAKIQP